MLTAGKPLLYLRFLKSYHDTRTKGSATATVAGLFLFAIAAQNRKKIYAITALLQLIFNLFSVSQRRIKARSESDRAFLIPFNPDIRAARRR